MRVFSLTQTGLAIASSPSNDQSDAHRLLSWLRKRGFSASDDQIRDYFGGDGMKARIAINKCMSGNSPALVERIHK